MKQLIIVLSLCLAISQNAFADELKIKSFQMDSYPTILEANKNQPFVLMIWSVTCSSCLAEMDIIKQVKQENPRINFVMLSVDGPDYYEQMKRIIKQKNLIEFEQWSFAEDNSSALRYVIDKQWYGEIPRTYFFNQQHKRIGISGLVNHEQYNQYLNKTSL